MKRILFCCFFTIALFCGPPIAHTQSDELRSTEWGSLQPDPKEPGVFRLAVSAWPADGVLLLGDNLTQVTRCSRQSKDLEQSVDFAWSDETHQLQLLADNLSESQRLDVLRIETSASSQQTEDGRIIFHPVDAKLVGEKLQRVNAGGQSWIGPWTNTNEQLSWSYKATRWGNYRVLLTYASKNDLEKSEKAVSANAPDPTFEIQIGEERRSAQLKPTSSLHQFATIDLGIVPIPREGMLTVSVRCLEAGSSMAVNLKAIVLVPACEGTTPTASLEDGSVTLHGRDSIVRGVTLRYEPANIKQTLGYWVRPTDRAEWWFRTHVPTAYDVEVWQGCGKGHGGSRVEVSVDNQPIEFTVEDTGHFQNFKPRIIGQVTLSSPGRHHLQIKPIQIANVAALDVRQVRLLPVATESPRALILPGERLQVGGRPGFVFLPPEGLRREPQPWVFYAPTLADVPDVHETWMHEQFLAAGIAVAGIDIGEGYGSPLSHPVMTAFYRELVDRRGFAARPCLLGRSRGGLWMSSWAAAHPEWVAGLAGIYPVFDLTSYPGIDRAASAYDLRPDELTEKLSSFNPIERVKTLAEAKIPVFLIHGDQDEVVPLEKNSAALQARYQAVGAGDLVTLEIAHGQGHNYWEGFFRSQQLVDFVIRSSR